MATPPPAASHCPSVGGYWPAARTVLLAAARKFGSGRRALAAPSRWECCCSETAQRPSDQPGPLRCRSSPNSRNAPRLCPGAARSERFSVQRGEDTKVISKEAQLFLTGSLLTTVIPSIYVLVFIISFPLNAAAVFMFSLKVRPQKPAAIFMLNLATADLLFVLLLPFKASYSFNGNNWVYGPAMCSVVTAAFYCNMYCSVLLMMSISADRFLAVVYPIRSLAWRRRRNAVAVCSAMWLLAVAGVIPILLSKQTMCLPQLGITTCHDVLDLSEERSYYLYFFLTFSYAFFFILVVTTACYVCIIQALRRTSGSKRSKKTRAVVMAFTVLTVFVVCFTPSNVLLLVHYSQFADQHSVNSYAAYLVSVCIGSVSCCLDPVIYYYGSSQCQKNIARLLHYQAPPAGSGSGSPPRAPKVMKSDEK
ncbi:proteinase-activated receptor 1-like [Conger conger]|uniref:proteinase-activated receptor 1-like n=1 Tax=Conger conger TaxID=82655 RepID=UPI002A5B03E6|nr:proteinase-activated receptor 1-like [Conger conger]